MSDLPKGWAKVKIPEVCELNPPKPTAKAMQPETLVTFVPMAAVNAQSGTIESPTIRPLREVSKGFTSFRENDVILAKITPCMENGKAAIAHVLSNGLGYGSTEFHVIRPKQAILPEFVFYLIRQESFRQLAEANMTGSVGQKRVPSSFLAEFEIPLAPITEQRRIVEKLEKLLGKVDSCQKRLEKIPLILKRFRQSVLAAACSGRLTANWRKQSPDHTDVTLMVKNLEAQRKAGNAVEILQEKDWPDEAIPASWLWIRFGTIIGELRNGISIRPNLEPIGIPILRISATRPGKVDLNDVRYLPNGKDFLPTYELNDGDLLFTRYNGSLELLGVCGMVRGMGKSVVLYPDKLMRVRFDHSFVKPEYAEIFFQARSVHERIIAKSKSSAGQNGVSGSDIKAQAFALPSLAEQQEIVRRVEALFKVADQIEARYNKAKAHVDKLAQSILAKAFRGELVPQDPNDEPASVLLERIRSQRTSPEPANKKARPLSKKKKQASLFDQA